jgi:hypothetical protein
METIASVLTLRPVLSMKWEFKGKVIRKRGTPKIEDFCIRQIHLVESFWGNTDVGEIVFIGHGARPTKLCVSLADPFFLHLKDSLPNPQNSP